ncbi:MAG TPA: PQQ-binding-like beta-propeller repeat protein, partial [Armatimonadota bacterium]
TPGGAIPPLVLGNQLAAGQIKVVLAYLNTDKPANGPGQLVTVPVVVPATAPAGASWTVKLTGVSLNGDTDIPIGTLGTATITLQGGTPPPPAGGGLPGPAGDGKADLNITDNDPAKLSNAITANAGDKVTVRINVDADAKNVQGVELVLDATTKSAGAPDLTGIVSSGTQVTANLGDIFTPGGAIPPLVLGNQLAAGQIKVVLAYLNTDKPGNGPGSLVNVPLQIPATATAGNSWTLKLTGVSLNGDTDIPVGTMGTATITVGGVTPPPPGPALRTAQAATANTLIAGTLVVQPGKAGTVHIVGANTSNVAGFALTLEYDPAVATYVAGSAKAPAGSIIAGTQAVTVNDGFTSGAAVPPAGKRWIRVAWTGDAGSAAGSTGPILELQFQGVATGAPYAQAPLSFVTAGGLTQDLTLGDATLVKLTDAGVLHAGSIILADSATGWSVQTGHLVSGSVSALGANVYVVDDGGMLRAYTNGAPLAGFTPVNVGAPVLGRPTLRNGNVYVLTTTGHMVKANATTGGAATLDKNLGAAASTSSPAVIGDRIYVGLNDGRVLALADADGSTVAQWPAPAAEGAIVSGPSADGNELWVGTNGGGLYALSTELLPQTPIHLTGGTGARGTQLSSAPFIVLAPGLALAYVGGPDGMVHKYNASTGAADPTHPTSSAGPAGIYAPIFVSGSTVVVSDESGNFRTLDAATLAQISTQKLGNGAGDAQAPIQTGLDTAGSTPNYYVPDLDGHLRILSVGATPAVVKDLVLGSSAVSAPAVTGQLRAATDVVVVANADGSVVALPIYPASAVTPPPTGDGKADLTITDTSATPTSTITAKAGDTVTVAINADVDAKNVQGLELVLDTTTKSAGAPDLTGVVASGTQVTANLGSMFTPGGAIPPLVLGNQLAAGQIKVVLAYLNTDKPANGPGQLVTVPVVVPATAPAGASWTVKLTGVSLNGDTDIPIGTLGTATISIAGGVTPPPPTGGGLPGPAGDSKADLNITDTTAALSNAITAKAGTEVLLQINVDADAKNIQGVELVLDSTTKSAGAPDLGAKITSGTQATVNLGSIFTPGGAIPPLVLGNQIAVGQIKVVLAYLNTDKPGNGPGPIVTVPVEIPAGAAVGASWTLKLTGVSLNGDTDIPLGTLGTATITVGS